MNDKVYIHEFIDIIGHNRVNYMHHMAANWSPIGQEVRNQKCYGIWGTVGTTRRWPEVVNMWEEDGFGGMASSFRYEFNHAGLQDPALAEWWAEAANFRRSGTDRLIVPASWTKTIDELCADGGVYETYAHELYTLPAGTAWDFVERVRTDAAPLLARHRWTLLGAFVTAMVPDNEVILLWGIDRWESWAEVEKGVRADPELGGWWRSVIHAGGSWHRYLLVDAALSPLRIHRQPAVSDRESYRLPTRGS